jgi:hypothetical protein
MKKFIILIPVYNDWESLKKLFLEIDENLKKIKNIKVDCIVINDASTLDKPEIKKPNSINTLKILNMKHNRGHARCNAFGIRYVSSHEEFDHLILMDGDGEDRPVELKSLISKSIDNQKNSVVAKRIKRSEGPFFQFLYLMHKMITYFFTGKNINFGNYSCLTKKDVNILSSKSSLWSSYSGTLKKNIKNLKEIESIRGTRYFGPSQMSLIKLIIHSFSIIAVYKKQVLLRSIIILFILILLGSYLNINLIGLQISIVTFCSIIFLVSLREKKKDLLNSHKNLLNVNQITH